MILKMGFSQKQLIAKTVVRFGSSRMENVILEEKTLNVQTIDNFTTAIILRTAHNFIK
jgi:hypothetical protein